MWGVWEEGVGRWCLATHASYWGSPLQSSMENWWDLMSWNWRRVANCARADVSVPWDQGESAVGGGAQVPCSNCKNCEHKRFSSP